MEVKDILPLVGVLIGSSLTVVGGLVQQRSARNLEDRKILRERLEGAYILCELVEAENNQSMKELTFAVPIKSADDDEKTSPRPLKKLSMLAHLYFPRLIEDISNLEKAVGHFASASISYYQEVAETNRIPKEKFAQLLGPPYTEVARCCTAVKKNIAREVADIH
jgi:hypothetical protein